MRKHLAIYLRLSSEDMNARSNRLNDESDSIRNQRLLVEQYISMLPQVLQDKKTLFELMQWGTEPR